MTLIDDRLDRRHARLRRQRLDRSSGTIYARATIQQRSASALGGYARVRLAVAPPVRALLVPMRPCTRSSGTCADGRADNVVTPKRVQVGDLRDGPLIRAGLTPDQ